MVRGANFRVTILIPQSCLECLWVSWLKLEGSKLRRLVSNVELSTNRRSDWFPTNTMRVLYYLCRPSSHSAQKKVERKWFKPYIHSLIWITREKLPTFLLHHHWKEPPLKALSIAFILRMEQGCVHRDQFSAFQFNLMRCWVLKNAKTSTDTSAKTNSILKVSSRCYKLNLALMK